MIDLVLCAYDFPPWDRSVLHLEQLTLFKVVPTHAFMFVQHEEKEAQRLAKRRLERERGRREATADMSEEFSEGEKVDLLSDVSTHGTKSRLPRINSAESMEIWANQQKGNKLYLVLIRFVLKNSLCFPLFTFLLGKLIVSPSSNMFTSK